jgi:sugar lactone lactonase YvrE
MPSSIRSFLLATSVLATAALASPLAEAATVTGTVTGPDGKPLRAAFVQARQAALKMTVSVLSDNQGKYVIENLPAGDYRIAIRAIGYKADPKTGIKLAADQNASHDFALTTTPVRWTEISQLQGYQLLPNLPGKQTLFENCMGCHGFQSKMAAVVRDEDGWRDRVNFMREAMRSSLADRRGFSDEQAEEVVSYLSHVFTEGSPLPKSPTDVPSYKDTVFTPSDEALKIVWVDYEMPGPNRFPWTSHGDKDGFRWTPEYGQANKVMRFDPKTAQMTEFPVPNMGPALIHSAVPAPDGSVWMTEAGAKKIAHWDPVTQKITEYQDDWRKHTIRVAPDGRIWSTGGLTVFDPKYETFTHIPEVTTAYGIAIDQKSNIWVTEMTNKGFLDKIDPVTLKVTKYVPPARDRPRRIQVDDDGMVWFAVFEDGKIDRFDPKAETFKEFPLPNAKSHPYALGIAPDHSLWYSSESRDVLGRLDPASGKVVEYPMPYTDNGMRDFFLDKDGHFWYGTPPNNRIGYFYLSTRQQSAAN